MVTCRGTKNMCTCGYPWTHVHMLVNHMVHNHMSYYLHPVQVKAINKHAQHNTQTHLSSSLTGHLTKFNYSTLSSFNTDKRHYHTVKQGIQL